MRNVATDTKLPGDNSPTTALVAGPNKEVIDATAAVAAASPANDLTGTTSMPCVRRRQIDPHSIVLPTPGRPSESRIASRKCWLLGLSVGSSESWRYGSVLRRRQHTTWPAALVCTRS